MKNRFRTLTTGMLVGLLLWPTLSSAQDFSASRAQVEGIPIGATIKLRTRDGERMKAVLMVVDASGIVVKPATRIPEPSRRLAFDSLDTVARYEDRVNVAKYVTVGAAIGASVFLMLLAGVR